MGEHYIPPYMCIVKVNRWECSPTHGRFHAHHELSARMRRNFRTPVDLFMRNLIRTVCSSVKISLAELDLITERTQVTQYLQLCVRSLRANWQGACCVADGLVFLLYYWWGDSMWLCLLHGLATEQSSMMIIDVFVHQSRGFSHGQPECSAELTKWLKRCASDFERNRSKLNGNHINMLTQRENFRVQFKRMASSWNLTG